MAYKLNDLTGQRFGRLTVIKQAPSLRTEYEYCTSYRTMWLCQCDCGETVIVAGEDMKRGHTKSCGCLRRETSRQSLKNICKSTALPK